jgi:hypothetical protein
MRLARARSRVSEANAKALSLLKAQLERWRNALPINSLGKRKTDREVLKAYLACRRSRSQVDHQPLKGPANMVHAAGRSQAADR